MIARFISPVETFKQMWQISFFDAAAAISNGTINSGIIFKHRDEDFAVFRRVMQPIADQIAKDLHNPVRISKNDCIFTASDLCYP
ncbi:hypothetical protein SDC9_146188 [bioreactor metagenome]|uniref:Uncharacterized protein n=1 Tax=bioreactor metagenome TaxID=1076179 RepID=A0A645ED23_9ZZZZ